MKYYSKFYRTVLPLRMMIKSFYDMVPLYLKYQLQWFLMNMSQVLYELSCNMPQIKLVDSSYVHKNGNSTTTM